MKPFPKLYIVFYSVISKDGLSFEVNHWIHHIQEDQHNQSNAWCGDIIVVKYKDSRLLKMVNISMADWPIIKLFFQENTPEI